MATVSHKTCSRCKLEKPAADFRRDKRATTGLGPSCRDCENAGKRERYAADPEGYRAKWRQDYRDHKERYERAARRYRAKNLERARQWVRNYSNKRRIEGELNLSSADFADWILAEPKLCRWCGCDCADNYHADHIIPLARGGRHELGNLTVACANCNLRKRNKLPEEFLAENADE